MSHVEADDLLARVESHGDPDDVQLLLSQFFHGYPITRLRALLRHQSSEVVKIGVWIASELGEMSKPLLDEVAALVSHPLVYVRILAVDCVLLAASGQDLKIIAKVVEMLRDDDKGVRWNAIHFLSRATRDQLAAAREATVDLSLGEGLEWLIRMEAESYPQGEILIQLKSDLPEFRKFAVAA